MNDHFTKSIKDSVAREYSKKSVLNAYSSFSANGFLEEEKILVNEHFKEPGRLLDIGCGGGRTVSVFQSLGFKVTGLELAGPMLHLAKKGEPDVCFIQSDAEYIPCKTGSFDYAFVGFNSWEHIPGKMGRKRFFYETARILKQKGLLYISFHSRYKWLMDGRTLFKNFQESRKLAKNSKYEYGDKIISGSGKTDNGQYENIYIHVSTPVKIKHCLQSADFEIIDCVAVKNKTVYHPAGFLHFLFADSGAFIARKMEKMKT